MSAVQHFLPEVRTQERRKNCRGCFNKTMEYQHEQAVADGVNVNYDVYRIRTKITQAGSKIDAGSVNFIKTIF